MILLNNLSLETTGLISTKFHVVPVTVETELRVCSNGQALLTVMLIYSKKIVIINILLFQNQEVLEQ